MCALQSKPDVGLDARGDNVWIVRPGNPDKRGQVHYGDIVVFESAKYPGYYIRYERRMTEQGWAVLCKYGNCPHKSVADLHGHPALRNLQRAGVGEGEVLPVN